jgi:hypothetical protein
MLLGPPELAFASFACVKFAGYVAAASALNLSYRSKENSVWKVGAARTALGLVAGAAYGGVFIWLMTSVAAHGDDSARPFILYFGGLVPVRLAEWSLIIWYFYQRAKPNSFLLLRNSAVGIIWSFVLDAVGVFALSVVPGGRWIC